MNRIFLYLLCLVLIGPAYSSSAIQSTITIDKSHVTLGDIFPMAPKDIAPTEVLLTPNPGQSVTLNQRWLTNIAQKYAIPYVASSKSDNVKVVGASDLMPKEDVEQILKEHLSQIIKNEAFVIKLDNPELKLHMPHGKGGEILITAAEINSAQTRFYATIVLSSEGKELQRTKVNGRIQDMKMAPTLNRAIAKGESIQSQDIQWTYFPSQQITRSTIQDEDSLIGAIAQRQDLPAGSPISKTDVHIPHMVTKNQAVVIHASSSFMDITAKGKVLESGAKNAYVKVMNTDSGRTFHATVIGPQQVRVDIPAMQNVALEE